MLHRLQLAFLTILFICFFVYLAVRIEAQDSISTGVYSEEKYFFPDGHEKDQSSHLSMLLIVVVGLALCGWGIVLLFGTKIKSRKGERKKINEEMVEINKCLLNMSVNYNGNINKLVELAGRLLNSDFAAYYKIEQTTIVNKSSWNMPDDNDGNHKIDEGHICLNVINSKENVVVLSGIEMNDFSETDTIIVKYVIKTYVAHKVKLHDGSTGLMALFYKKNFKPTDIDIELLGIVVSAIATEEERKLHSKATEDAEREKNLILSSISETIIFTGRDMTISWINSASQDIFGIEPEKIIGKKCCDVWHMRGLEQNECIVCPIKTVLETGKIEEGEIKTPENKIIHIKSNPVFNDAGEVNGSVSIVSDITEKKRLEQERRQIDTQIQQAQKLESLGVLAGGVAHDFNNLLMVILGNADLASREIQQNHMLQPRFAEIINTSKRAAELCSQLLAYSGRGTSKIESVNLNELIVEMNRMLEISISKKIILRTEFMENLPYVKMDATQMRQIIMNLIINASEAIGTRSGIINMRTGLMECDNKYLNGTYLRENLNKGFYVFLEISDTGCGMNKDTVDKIFEPFFTTKFTGRGLGLAAIMGIIRAHNGAIKVYSEVGKGTTFKILIPAIFSNERDKNDLGSKSLWKGSGKILLVDDDESVRAICKGMLEMIGFEVVIASNGKEALTVFKKFPESFKCVILDLTMPVMGGEDCFSELVNVKDDIKVFITSGYSEKEIAGRFVGKKITGCIQKPYQISVITEKLSKVL